MASAPGTQSHWPGDHSKPVFLTIILQQQLERWSDQLGIYSSLFIYTSQYFTKSSFLARVRFSGSVHRSTKASGETLRARLGLRLPERTPANVALAEVFMGRGLLDEQLHLCWDIQSVIVREVPTGELIADPVNDLNGFLV